ncbi:MAG: hydroxyphenylacetyl-CoA thioesterase PaaI [Flavobacteriales bacterium]|nr:hydroxyphenylacetyl-CoA thioesterase PaaI [Flavobacteriales bacterium]
MSQIIDRMLESDAFSNWMGIEVLESGKGHCKLKMLVRPEMCNGFGIAHGGITFSFADSALAFASNTHGKKCVALDCSISFPNAVKVGETIFAEAKEESLTNKTGIYLIKVTNQNNDTVALFKGTVYRTSKEW